MPNSYFQFKQFRVDQGQCAMKVSTETCILGAWVEHQSAANALDIGTGTGVLSLMLAQRHDCTIDAVEIESNAAEQAKNNFGASPWKNRLKVFHSDIESFAQQCSKKYDLIISNPPFFADSLKSVDPKNNLAKHDGLSKIVLAKSIKRLLSTSGTAFVLLPEKEIDDLKVQAQKLSLDTIDSLVIRNSENSGVFRKILALGELDTVRISELTIREESGNYSNFFQKLLQPYYLKL